MVRYRYYYYYYHHGANLNLQIKFKTFNDSDITSLGLNNNVSSHHSTRCVSNCTVYATELNQYKETHQCINLQIKYHTSITVTALS